MHDDIGIHDDIGMNDNLNDLNNDINMQQEDDIPDDIAEESDDSKQDKSKKLESIKQEKMESVSGSFRKSLSPKVQEEVKIKSEPGTEVEQPKPRGKSPPPMGLSGFLANPNEDNGERSSSNNRPPAPKPQQAAASSSSSSSSLPPIPPQLQTEIDALVSNITNTLLDNCPYLDSESSPRLVDLLVTTPILGRMAASQLIQKICSKQAQPQQNNQQNNNMNNNQQGNNNQQQQQQGVPTDSTFINAQFTTVTSGSFNLQSTSPRSSRGGFDNMSQNQQQQQNNNMNMNTNNMRNLPPPFKQQEPSLLDRLKSANNKNKQPASVSNNTGAGIANNPFPKLNPIGGSSSMNNNMNNPLQQNMNSMNQPPLNQQPPLNLNLNQNQNNQNQNFGGGTSSSSSSANQNFQDPTLLNNNARNQFQGPGSNSSSGNMNMNQNQYQNQFQNNSSSSANNNMRPNPNIQNLQSNSNVPITPSYPRNLPPNLMAPLERTKHLLEQHFRHRDFRSRQRDVLNFDFV